MKYYSILLSIFFFISCGSNKTEQEREDSKPQSNEIAVDKDEKVVRKYVESIVLNELIPQKRIIDDVFDEALRVLRNDTHQKYLLDDYKSNKFDCYLMSLDISSFGDTTCQILPGWLERQVFVSNHYVGYYMRSGCPIIVSGDVASLYFSKRKRTKEFISGMPAADERIITYPVFVLSGNDYWQIR